MPIGPADFSVRQRGGDMTMGVHGPVRRFHRQRLPMLANSWQ